MALTKTPIELSSTPGIVDNSNATAITIDASENVGIGVSNPSDYYATNLVVTGPSEGGITIASTGNHTNYLLFADSTSGVARYAGMIEYAHSLDQMAFRTNSIQRMVIDSVGTVTIVKNGGTAFTPLSYDGLVVQNGDATGIRIIDAGDGSGNGGHTGLGNDNGNLRVMTAGTMVFATGLSPTDQLYQGGDERMRILSTGGITFNGDTAQANALDDYEEGVATISILAASTNPSINEGNTFTGYYTKVGNVCTIVGYTGTRTFANTGSGNPRFSGLPFASKSGPYAIAQFTHNTFFTNSTAGYVETGSNYFYPIVDNSTPVASIAGTGARFLMFSLTYITA